jgi:WD40 repeat protein
LRDRIPVGASLLSLDWSSDGSLIAVGGNDAVVSLIDAKKGVAVSSLRGHAAPVAAATFSPDGTRLASTGLGKSTLVWDLTPPGLGEVRAYPGLDQVMQLVPAPGGTRIYTSNFAGVVNVLDARAGKVLRTIPGQLVRWPVGIALSGDGQWLATTDAATKVASVRDTRTFVGESELGPGLHVKAFNGDASQVVVDGSGQGRAYVGPPRVLRAAGGRELFRLDGSAPIQAAEWSPDGTLLATATIAPDPACRDVPAPCFAYVYDARSGQRLAAIVIDGVADVAFSPDGLQLAVSGNGVRILDVKALREGRVVDVATLPNRSGSTNVQTIEFTRDGSELVTGSLNPELVVWDTSTWELKYTIRAPYANPSMALLATGREVASAGLGGSGLVVYTLDVDRLIELARNRLTRSFTTAECVRYLHLDECPPS